MRYLHPLLPIGLAGLLTFHCNPVHESAQRQQGISVTLTDCMASSLSNAINSANTAAAAGDVGPHQITLMGGCTYSMTTVDNYWYGPNALPPVMSNVIIDGTATGAIIESAPRSTAKRLFFVASATLPPKKAGKLTLRNLTLRGGTAQGGSAGPALYTGGGGLGAGGAIFSQGDVVLDAVTVSGNTAQGGAASASTSGGVGSTGGGGIGGGSADIGGGGFHASTTSTGGEGLVGTEGGLPNVTIVPGLGGTDLNGNENGQGGAAANSGGGTRGLGSARPTPIGDGGGGRGAMNCTGGGGAGFGGSGGAGTYTMIVACGGGGGFGGGGAHGAGGGVGGGGGAGFTNTQGGGGGFGGGGGGAGDSASTLGHGGDGGFGGGGGAGIEEGGMAGFGAGAAVAAGCGTTGGSGGGGLGAGGAVFLHIGTLTVVNSTLEQNQALGGAGGAAADTCRGNGGSGYGGAIFNLNGTVTVVNSTIANNVVEHGDGATVGSRDGGAIYTLGFGNLTPTALVTIKNSIFAGNMNAANDVVNNQSANTTATVHADVKNIIQGSIRNVGGATSTGTPSTSDPMLQVKTGTGTIPDTLAPQAGSLALGYGDVTTCLAPSTDFTTTNGVDELGAARPNCQCDVGALQVTAAATACPMDMSVVPTDMTATAGNQDLAMAGPGTDQGTYELTGGGFSCSQAASRTGTPASGEFALSLALFGLLLRRRKSAPTA